MQISDLNALFAVAALFSFCTAAVAEDKKPASGLVTLKANCTTDATGGDGRRKACDSAWQEYQTPGDFVIAEISKTVRETSANGSEHECLSHFDKYVEVIPGTGIKQPTVFRLRAHARSPKGHWAGRGWEYCEATFVQVEVPHFTEKEMSQWKAMPPLAPETEESPDLQGSQVQPSDGQVDNSMN
ncbi:hypothetical protein NKI98_17955 [Mesorhizobium sp. M0222]|uniref:hypothetical protein n=1 Tax=Mesorhizobium sp. M0222 TaxID=2956921 RepID=UPI00333A44FA